MLEDAADDAALGNVVRGKARARGQAAKAQPPAPGPGGEPPPPSPALAALRRRWAQLIRRVRSRRRDVLQPEARHPGDRRRVGRALSVDAAFDVGRGAQQFAVSLFWRF